MPADRRYQARFGSILATAAILALGACDADGDQELSARIAVAASNGDSAVVDITKLTAFPWERLHVFGPYTTSEKIEKELGFSWRRSDAIEMFDHFALLVFVQNQRVVRFVVHDRGNGDLCGSHRQGGYLPSTAVFRCRKDSQGVPRCRS